MGTLVLHAGRGKTGSSSVQRWLAENARRLHAEHGVHVLDVRACSQPGESSFEIIPCTRRSAKSHVDQAPLNAIQATELFTQLDRCLQQHDPAVVTSEAFGAWFHNANGEVLPVLEEFALAHDLRVAYYVRPQHTTIEAHWRQWGFRWDLKPSDFVRKRLPFLHYLATADCVRDAAPHVSFVMRPFRRDLLEGGDVVTDFTKVFLGLGGVQFESDDVWENRGFPLDWVNTLRHAPPGLFWDSPHDNAKLSRLRRLVSAEPPIVESSKVLESRALLQAFCYQEYESGNQELIRRMGWHTDHFVPPVPSELNVCIDLGELDLLWEPDASEQEQAFLFNALTRLLDLPQPSKHIATAALRSPHQTDALLHRVLRILK